MPKNAMGMPSAVGMDGKTERNARNPSDGTVVISPGTEGSVFGDIGSDSGRSTEGSGNGCVRRLVAVAGRGEGDLERSDDDGTGDEEGGMDRRRDGEGGMDRRGDGEGETDGMGGSGGRGEVWLGEGVRGNGDSELECPNDVGTRERGDGGSGRGRRRSRDCPARDRSMLNGCLSIRERDSIYPRYSP